ncbi:hypothetical protein BSKO_05977 [Bryopsis sp. KO-2023]|nr:hypothetical protein BSKO_05977 [Bryopsis sp. KO-2023]
MAQGTVFAYRYNRRAAEKERRKTTKRKALLEWFANVFGVRKQKKRPLQKKFFKGASKNGAVIASTAQRCEIPTPSYMIHPLSSAKYVWDWMVTVVVLYNAVLVPWNFAFKLTSCDGSEGEGDACQTSWDQAVMIALDVFFWVDIVLAFRTGYIDEKMNVYMDPPTAAKYYAKTWFALDLVANFPAELIGTVLVKSGNARGLLALQFFRAPRLLRIVRLSRSEKHHAAPTLFRLVKMTLVFAMISHWCGCLWYFLGRWQAENVGANAFTGGVTWIEVPLGDASDGGEVPTYRLADFQTKYTAAVYWALTTMSTVGFGDILPKTNMERFFTMGVQFLGATCTALILGNVAVLIANFDNSTSRFRDRMDTFEEFVKVQQISPQLADDVRENLKHSWIMQQGIDVGTALCELPDNLKTSVLMYMQCNIVKGSYLFKNCDQAFIKAVVVRLRPQGYLPEDYVVKAKEAATEMYFVRHGKMKVLGENDVLLAILKQGDLFGELELFAGGRRTADVQALTPAELYILSIGDFEEVLAEFPEYFASLKDTCQRRASEFADRRERRAPSKHHGPAADLCVLRSVLAMAGDELPGQIAHGIEQSDSSSSDTTPDASPSPEPQSTLSPILPLEPAPAPLAVTSRFTPAEKHTPRSSVVDIKGEIRQVEKMQQVLLKTERMQNDMANRIVALSSQLSTIL